MKKTTYLSQVKKYLSSQIGREMTLNEIWRGLNYEVPRNTLYTKIYTIKCWWGDCLDIQKRSHSSGGIELVITPIKSLCD